MKRGSSSYEKARVTPLVVSDLDPAGDAIAADLVKCFRRDYDIKKIEAFKVALTIEQVEELDLEPSMDAKKSRRPTMHSLSVTV